MPRVVQHCFMLPVFVWGHVDVKIYPCVGHLSFPTFLLSVPYSENCSPLHFAELLHVGCHGVCSVSLMDIYSSELCTRSSRRHGRNGLQYFLSGQYSKHSSVLFQFLFAVVLHGLRGDKGDTECALPKRTFPHLSRCCWLQHNVLADLICFLQFKW